MFDSFVCGIVIFGGIRKTSILEYLQNLRAIYFDVFGTLILNNFLSIFPIRSSQL